MVKAGIEKTTDRKFWLSYLEERSIWHHSKKNLFKRFPKTSPDKDHKHDQTKSLASSKTVKKEKSRIYRHRSMTLKNLHLDVIFVETATITTILSSSDREDTKEGKREVYLSVCTCRKLTCGLLKLFLLRL